MTDLILSVMPACGINCELKLLLKKAILFIIQGKNSSIFTALQLKPLTSFILHVEAEKNGPKLEIFTESRILS